MTSALSCRGVLCLVTDRGLCRGRPLEAVVEAALEGGVTMVQLREKDATTRAFVELARRIQVLVRRYNVPLIINDRLDVALTVDAAGVHLGQQDLPVAEARRLLGPDKIIGLSIESVEQATAANHSAADYFGISPVYATATKPDAPPALGLEGVVAIRAKTDRPLMAIGGIAAQNAADVMRAGSDSLAVVSAICSADDPAAAARTLAAIMKGAE